jgi:hypothetical protein
MIAVSVQRMDMLADASYADRTESAVAEIQLVVNLDGTLVRSDLLVESLLGLIWRGMKHGIAAKTAIDATHLPYDERVLALIEEARCEGRRSTSPRRATSATSQRWQPTWVPTDRLPRTRRLISPGPLCPERRILHKRYRRSWSGSVRGPRASIEIGCPNPDQLRRSSVAPPAPLGVQNSETLAAVG